jgi:hypothetical protein
LPPSPLPLSPSAQPSAVRLNFVPAVREGLPAPCLSLVKWNASEVESLSPLQRRFAHLGQLRSAERVVYNIEMKGPFAYGGRDDSTILYKQRHAVPKPDADGSSGLITLLVTLTDSARNFYATSTRS